MEITAATIKRVPCQNRKPLIYCDPPQNIIPTRAASWVPFCSVLISLDCLFAVASSLAFSISSLTIHTFKFIITGHGPTCDIFECVYNVCLSRPLHILFQLFDGCFISCRGGQRRLKFLNSRTQLLLSFIQAAGQSLDTPSSLCVLFFTFLQLWDRYETIISTGVLGVRSTKSCAFFDELDVMVFNVIYMARPDTWNTFLFSLSKSLKSRAFSSSRSFR